MKHPILNKTDLVKNLVYGSSAMITTGLFMVQQAFCGGADWISGSEEVTVDIGSLDPNSMVNKVVTLICAIISIGGVVTMAQGYGTYSSGHAEDNSATESKGIRKMIAGMVAVAAPWVFKWIIGQA